MSDTINTNVFTSDKKFVDLNSLEYFWSKSKTYIDDADKSTADKITALEGVVGDDTKGLIKDFNDLKTYTESLGDIEGGEGLGGMIDSKIATLDVEDSAVDGQYVSAVSEVDGKIVVTRADLPVYEEVGAATQALTDAKAYVDGIVGDVTSEDGVVTKGLNSRVNDLEAIDHNKLAADAASAAVANVIDGAPEKFDTLKEIAAWIADADTAEDAASLVTRVTALEAIDHDAYVEADKTVLADAKAYADGLVAVDGVAKFDTAGAAATAKAEAIADAEAKLKAVTDTLKSAAFTEVATLEATMDSKDTIILEAAKTYASTYTDTLFDSFHFAEDADIDGIFEIQQIFN